MGHTKVVKVTHVHVVGLPVWEPESLRRRLERGGWPLRGLVGRERSWVASFGDEYRPLSQTGIFEP